MYAEAREMLVMINSSELEDYYGKIISLPEDFLTIWSEDYQDYRPQLILLINGKMIKFELVNSGWHESLMKPFILINPLDDSEDLAEDVGKDNSWKLYKIL